MKTTPGTEKKRGRGGTWVLLLIILGLALSQIYLLTHREGPLFLVGQSLGAPRKDGASEEDGEPRALPPDDELEARGYIASNLVRAYAEEYNVGTEFLSRLFPDSIVYKQGGAILYEPIRPELRRSAYPREAFTWEAGRPRYEDGAGNRALIGVDVSRYQGVIDWRKVAGDGIDFAMIRVGYRGYGSGDTMADEYFAANMAGAADAGLPVGLYYFSQAVTEEEAAEEAEIVLAGAAGYDVRFPIVYDMEDISGKRARTDDLTAERATDVALAFCERIRRAGYTPMIYGNPRHFVTRLDLSRTEDVGKWVAQYYKVPAYPYAFSIWQYSDSGEVAGIKGKVDMDMAFPEAFTEAAR